MEQKIRNSIGIYAFIQLYHLDRQTPDIMIESIVEGVCIHTRTHTHMKRIKNYLRPFMSLKFLICFLSAWMITNGWAYVFVVLGPILKIDWMTKVGVSYQTFLWLPCTPEKLVTIPLAAFFNFLLFKDKKTQEALDKMKQQAIEDLRWRRRMNDKELIALIMMVYSKDTPPEFKDYLTRLKFFKNGRPTKKLVKFIAKYKLPLIIDA